MSDDRFKLSAMLRGHPYALNVANVALYLSAIGVELTDEQVQSWNDTEAVHRYLSRERNTVVRDGRDLTCQNGHTHYVEGSRKARRRKKGKARPLCPTCGAEFWRVSLRWTESRDGTIKDYRPRSERWKPLDAPTDSAISDPPSDAGA